MKKLYLAYSGYTETHQIQMSKDGSVEVIQIVSFFRTFDSVLSLNVFILILDSHWTILS